ncbi:hypothetical protein COLSTE_00121 [Collinsella stercoris DSM 13279]|uniref:Uncharacterized protein n=1 Tax=Collinsella stercoris DSM 13279 TaxID=445975 RepID=B6G7T1_9ACTN|nr:hypothetical protein COLSTE_00121 [Collinsella stercoris DSM 13279]
MGSSLGFSRVEGLTRMNLSGQTLKKIGLYSRKSTRASQYRKFVIT